MTEDKLIRGTIVHFLDDPWVAGPGALEVLEDGVLVIRDGKIVETGNARDILDNEAWRALPVVDHRGQFVFPGFIDTHLHYPQADVIASHGKQLLEWLERFTFPAEQKFSDKDHAAQTADFFTKELLRNGTTTAMMFATVHPQSVDAIFECASQLDMRMAAGKVMMDRNCPELLRDTARQSYEDSQQLIDRWHGRQRLSYAVTPRFAPTSTDQQLEFAGKLFAENKGVYLQSHVAENQAEVKWVAELFPWARSYLDVYDHFGLLGNRAVYAHCIYLDTSDLQRMKESETTAAFCPTSNLFLGSGLFDLTKAKNTGVRTGMATDVGGGTSFSMLRTADEAYKVTQMSGGSITPVQLFYEITLGGAASLSMEQFIGNFEAGKEADLVVLDPHASDLLARRMECAQTLEEKLFAFIVLGDDRCTTATYLMGNQVYARASE